MGDTIANLRNPNRLRKRCLYGGWVDPIDDLVDCDLAEAAQTAASVVPDVVSSLDRLVPLLATGGDRSALRRYLIAVDAAAQTLTESFVNARAPASAVACHLMEQSFGSLLWLAPSPDGLGVVTALVDRIRGLFGGLAQQCTKPRDGIDAQRFVWFMGAVAELEFGQRCASPLRTAMATLALSSADTATLMGVTRQAVDKWLMKGPPADRIAKIGAVVEIADILRHHLQDGMPAIVARRPADAYDGRNMLEMIAGDDHEQLLRSVKHSFDFNRVA